MSGQKYEAENGIVAAFEIYRAVQHCPSCSTVRFTMPVLP